MINPMMLIAIIIGTAAITRARSGTNNSDVESRIGPMLSFRVAALASCTRVTEPRDAATRSLPFTAPIFSFRLSKNAMRDNGRMGFK